MILEQLDCTSIICIVMNLRVILLKFVGEQLFTLTFLLFDRNPWNSSPCTHVVDMCLCINILIVVFCSSLKQPPCLSCIVLPHCAMISWAGPGQFSSHLMIFNMKDFPADMWFNWFMQETLLILWTCYFVITSSITYMIRLRS